MESIGFGVFGAGRIGHLHARHLAGAVDGARLVIVMDADGAAAERAAFGGAIATTSGEAVLEHPEVDAILIASPTDRHAEQIVAAARAGKAIFCEKPVALDLGVTIRAMEEVRSAGVPFGIGFNRRFDPGYAAVAKAVQEGEIGRVEMFRSLSSDPAVGVEGYIATSGGFYRDSVIHDIDTARFMVGEVERVSAVGRVMTSELYAKYDDVDTSIVTLEFANGAIGVLQNTRRTVYGYDLRVEVFGERGKLVTEDERATKMWRYEEGGVRGDYFYYFVDRFRDAYRLELQAFVDALREGQTPSPGIVDAIESLRVADAATASVKEGRPIEVGEIDGR
jgi:myo-inositol 2-dehydrogenase / D-chiro-inositol 1-dehydrogenase